MPLHILVLPACVFSGQDLTPAHFFPLVLVHVFFWFFVGGGWDQNCFVGSVGGRGVTASRGSGEDLHLWVDRENKGTAVEKGCSLLFCFVFFCYLIISRN